MKHLNTLAARLSTQRALVGLLQLDANLRLVELAARCGYDFLFLDGEYGTFSEADFERHLAALAATPMLAMVRVAGHDASALRRYVDLGAEAIIVPHISTVEEATVLVRAMPREKRASLIVILESGLGVENAEKILDIEGVDAAIIGPNDLSADLGCPGDYAHPLYAQAFSSIEHASASTGKILGTVPHGGYPLEVLLERGHRLLILGTDRSLVREAMGAQVTRAKACFEDRFK